MLEGRYHDVRAHRHPHPGERDHELAAKLEPAQLFHELLDHRWYMSEQQSTDAGLMAAVRSYVHDVLKHAPEERVRASFGAAPLAEPLNPPVREAGLRRPSRLLRPAALTAATVTAATGR